MRTASKKGCPIGVRPSFSQAGNLLDPSCVLDDSMGETTLVGKGRFVGDPSIRSYCGKMRQANKVGAGDGYRAGLHHRRVARWWLWACRVGYPSVPHAPLDYWRMRGAVDCRDCRCGRARRRVFIDFDLDDDAAISGAACEEVARRQ